MSAKKRYDLDDRLPYLINRIGGSLVAFASPGLARFDLTIPLWRILAVLAHRGELRQIDLADATSIDPPTVSRLVTSALRKGFVTRKRSDTSNREVTVRLTRKGQDVVDKILPQMLADEAVVFAGLSGRDLSVVKSCLRQMYHNIAAHRAALQDEGKIAPRRKGKAVRKKQSTT